MARAAAFSPLQLFTPLQLVVCVILFFLPWINVQAVPHPDVAKEMPKEQVEKMRKEFGVDPTKPIGMISQSGLQIANGTASLASDLKRILDKLMEKFGGNMKMDKSPETELNEELKKKEVTAPLLFLCPVALLGGIVLGFIPWAGMVRKILVASCCAVAFLIVGMQAAVGFPLENEIKEELKKEKGGGGMFRFPGMGGMGGGKVDAKEHEPLRVAWKLPLYLTFLLLIASTGTAFLGPSGAPARYKKRRPSRYDDDDEDEDDRPRKKKQKALSLDDDDEGEEEERPARKRRRDDDDDEEDDRPRKKKPAQPAFEVVDEPSAPASDNPFAFDDDEPPRKKKRPRDDDDDEDDRPRKKRRRDDD